MKNKYSLFGVALCGLLLSLLFNCKKETQNGAPAIVSTTVISKITPVSATAGAVVISDEGAKVTSRGFCWGTVASPDINGTKSQDSTGIGDFTTKLSELIPGTTYYIRAYASNSAGITYGEEVSFRPTPLPEFNTGLTYGTVTDVDGNIYKTVQIGTQTWMAENLKTIHYRNGDPIPNVKDNAEWAALTTGAYCDYGNNEEYAVGYGRLYNGYAVIDIRNIAPEGWHVPGNAEWTTLENYLGGYSAAASKLKESGTDHWYHGNNTNESGFTALPGGIREGGQFAGPFANMTMVSNFWTNSVWGSTYMYYRNLQNNAPSLQKNYGMSVRCVKD